MYFLMIILLFLILIAQTKTNAMPEANAKPKPNVILIMADDLGWGDTGYNGNKVIKTPHLDTMAADGLQMNRFYSASAVCSPTQCALVCLMQTQDS
jgi:arylsulfatase A-like enzyme